MKILFITHNFYPRIGGIEINSELLASKFAEAGHEVRVLTWTIDPEHTSFSFKVIRNPKFNALLKNHLWADLIFENNPALRLSWPALFTFRPQVIAVRTWIQRSDGSKGIQDYLKTFWLKRAKKVIAVSEAVRRKSNENAIVIGNPFRINDFKIIPGIKRSKDFVFLGRLVSDKGADQAILAIHHFIQRSSCSTSLTIVGDGPEKNKLEKLVKDLKISKYVNFTGILRGDDLNNCLNQHKFILIPSLWEEPFGNVALEGMASGCIPVVSDGGGLPDAVGPAGLVFKRGNLKSLIESINRLTNEPNLQNKLKEKAVEKLAAHHPAVVARRYLDVLEAVVTEQKNVII